MHLFVNITLKNTLKYTHWTGKTFLHWEENLHRKHAMHTTRSEYTATNSKLYYFQEYSNSQVTEHTKNVDMGKNIYYVTRTETIDFNFVAFL